MPVPHLKHHQKHHLRQAAACHNTATLHAKGEIKMATDILACEEPLVYAYACLLLVHTLCDYLQLEKLITVMPPEGQMPSHVLTHIILLYLAEEVNSKVVL